MLSICLQVPEHVDVGFVNELQAEVENKEAEVVSLRTECSALYRQTQAGDRAYQTLVQELCSLQAEEQRLRGLTDSDTETLSAELATLQADYEAEEAEAQRLRHHGDELAVLCQDVLRP